MKNANDTLDRLLRAASQAPAPAIDEIPFAIQSRTLAHWRSQRLAPDTAGFLTILRRGLAMAALVALIAVGFTVQQNHRVIPDETSIVDDAIQLALSD